MLAVLAANWQPKVTVLHRLSDLTITSGPIPDTEGARQLVARRRSIVASSLALQLARRCSRSAEGEPGSAV